MAEDVKNPAPSPPPKGDDKATTEKTTPNPAEAQAKADPTPVTPATKPAAASASAAPPAPKPDAAAGTPPKAAAAAATPTKPAAPAKPAGPVPTPWSSPMVEKYKKRYGSGLEALTYLGQNYFNVDRSLIPDLLRLLNSDDEFDYCVDLTAVHYPKREKQFDLVWVLYSFPRNERIRVKTQMKDGESIASVVSIWPTANWLEREVFDMFGIRFDGHPDMKRILLPDGWEGYPLRKDYDILQQDKKWVRINLGIESGQ
ncbi:MAG TPA: NADH-quinone oxidoreductase subunit C [Terriglobales bacterium]|nr:NADH-quinone oxidoreductase subunit C [Terriglobales bacterium]